MNIIESKVVKMKVGFIGGGNMGGALIGGLTQKCCAPSDIALYEKDAQKAAAFKEMGINTVESASAAEAASEIIVFSVKPNIIDSVLSEMSGDKNKIYLSIAAGVTVAHLEEMLGADKKIVRAMPNTPAQVGCGMTVISPNKNVDDEDIKKVKMLLSAVGMVQQMDEKFMSVATALHGSSPAYVYMFIDAMADAQDVYVRVSSTSGGMNDSKKLTIKSSDIFEINKFGFEDEDKTKFKRIDVTKNFNYSDEVTFVAATYNNLGALTSIALKKAYGDQLTIGANKVTMSLDLPDTFDKVNDKFNAFVLTKLSSDGETAVDENMTVAKNGTSVNVANIPAFDTGAKVVVMALKKDADETDVKSEDILYFTQITATDIADSALTIPAYEAGMQIKLSGNINGVHTVVKTVAE